METLAHRLSRLSLRTLPRTWRLRIELRGVHRHYVPLIDRAKPDEEDLLIGEYMHFRDEITEQLEGIASQRLIRTAEKYHIVPPAIPWSGKAHLDENWSRGSASGTWRLKPAAIALLWRQIEDAKKRRLDVWDARAKILGGLISGLVGLGSVLVSLVLACSRQSPN